MLVSALDLGQRLSFQNTLQFLYSLNQGVDNEKSVDRV